VGVLISVVGHDAARAWLMGPLTCTRSPCRLGWCCSSKRSDAQPANRPVRSRSIRCRLGRTAPIRNGPGPADLPARSSRRYSLTSNGISIASGLAVLWKGQDR
jgi:hypothetical protein